MEKEVLKEICKDLKGKDRVIVKMFRRTFMKVYHKVRINIFNNSVR